MEGGGSEKPHQQTIWEIATHSASRPRSPSNSSIRPEVLDVEGLMGLAIRWLHSEHNEKVTCLNQLVGDIVANFRK
jgi:hypothetical protein